MKIDYEKLKSLAALPDAQLWATVRAVAAEKGFTLPDTPPSPEDMAKLRGVMKSAEGVRMTDAMRMLNQYKKKYMK